MINLLDLNPADIDISGTVIVFYRDSDDDRVWWSVFVFEHNRFIDILDSSGNSQEDMENIRKLSKDFDIRGLMLGQSSAFWMYVCEDEDYLESIRQFKLKYPEEFL